ncbi:hypothetical protein RF11_16233 [Thelohanellus kitauei]|uniref:Uncharacterized protein n=1 Tax=Thelohanellus kitauei TaxID=669202 RepID=A0A0C2IAN2_THEKT|nr:hypothetical protein RF11_16233 [Thelohanellus kitauei]
MSIKRLHRSRHNDFSRSVKHEVLKFPIPDEETKKKIFQARLQRIENTISNDLLDSFITSYTVKDFEKIIELSIVFRDSRSLNRSDFTTSDENNPETSPKIESFSDLKKALKCTADSSSPPPLIDDDLRGAEKKFLYD